MVVRADGEEEGKAAKDMMAKESNIGQMNQTPPAAAANKTALLSRYLRML